MDDARRSDAGRAVEAALRSADADDVARELEERERAARRHALWAVLGVSPAGLLPLVLTASEPGVYALLAGLVAVSGVEAVRAFRARSEAASLRERLHLLTSGRS